MEAINLSLTHSLDNHIASVYFGDPSSWEGQDSLVRKKTHIPLWSAGRLDHVSRGVWLDPATIATDPKLFMKAFSKTIAIVKGFWPHCDNCVMKFYKTMQKQITNVCHWKVITQIKCNLFVHATKVKATANGSKLIVITWNSKLSPARQNKFKYNSLTTNKSREQNS